MALVEVRDVTKTFKKGEHEITPLKDVSIDVHQGDFVSLMGASGSGKSTLLNLIAGIDRPTAGRVVVAGQDITRLSRTKLAYWRAANAGYIFQTHNLIPVLTAWENVEMPLLLLPLSRAERRKRVGIALEAVGLSDRADHYPRQLSGGQEQRVGIARAIVANPTVVVADEPTGDLDAETTGQILDLLVRLNEELGTTLMMVTHDPHAAGVARRRLRLEKGQLIEGEPALRVAVAAGGLSMFKFAPYVLKSLLRHRARTLLTVSGTAVALFVFAFIGAAQQGLADMTRGKQAERTLIVFQANRFCPSTSRLPQDYEAAIRKVPGVRNVVPMQVYVNNCRASLDLVLFHGLPPEKLKTARDIRMLSGDREAFDRQADAALVGSALARRRGLSPGQKFSIGEITVTVVGVFAAATPAEENVLYTHLSFLQRVKGRNVGEATMFEVQLAEDASTEAAAREIDAAFSRDRVPTDTRPKGVFQASVVGDLTELIGWANYLGYACVGLVLSLVTTTTVMAVQDRVREHAVLQAIGFSSPRVFGLVLSEGVIVSLIGGLLGVGAALVALWRSRLAVGTEGVTIALSPSLALAGQGLAVSFAVGVLAGVIPAWRATTAEIVTALRAV